MDGITNNSIEAVRQWFRTCPLLNGERVGVNYIGDRATSFAVVASPSAISTHQNVLGEDIPDDIQQLNFSFAATDAYGADILVNASVQKLYDDIVQWILDQNSARRFPDLRHLGAVRSVTPTLTAYPSQVGADTAVYRIQLKIMYRRY